MNKKELKIFVIITAVFAAAESALLLCIPFVNINGLPKQRVSAYVLAAAFWFCVLAELVFVVIASKIRKKAESDKKSGQTSKRPLPGIICFFRNPEAAAADVIFLLSAIGIALIIILKVEIKWLIIAGISVLLLSFNLHCIMNGRNYRYLRQK